MREQIINVLNDKYEALDVIEINDLLGLTTPEDLSRLGNDLESLYKDNILYKTKKGKFILFKNCPNLKVGVLSLKKGGFGFLLVPTGEDIYIDKSNINNAVNDDKVLVELVNNYGKIEGKVLRVLNRDLNNLIGEVYYIKDKPYVKLEDKKKNIEIKLDEKASKGVVAGTKVIVTVLKEMSRNKYMGKINTIIGHKDDPGVDIKLIAYKYNIYEEFSSKALEQTDNIPTEVNDKDLIGRTDLTDKMIFTIDGDDTKDIDDAISYEYKDGLHILGVHIADVSYYVTENSYLDKDALERGTSSYLADSVIPMLPHKLSNGICSLNPNVDRLAQSCIMEIDSKGNVVSHEIFESVIRSRIQMTYKKVNNWLENHVVEEGYEPYTDDLTMMMELSKIIRDNRSARGAIDFDTKEAKILADENGKPTDVILRNRGVGEKMIEDFMIAANETVASHVFWMGLPFVYRVHGTPKEEKINDFLDFVSSLGYKITGKVNIKYPSSIENILRQLRDKKEYEVLSTLMLRAMQ